MNEQPVAPGQTLAGKYRIDRVLGAGAMGMVLAATHLVLGSRVAIKVMLGGGKKGPEQEERFLREARLASKLKSEHAGKVLDVGLTEQGAPYIVMEFLEGQDLGALLKERGPLPVPEAVTYVLQACEAIAEAHALGIVHRDIKPANLFLTTRFSGEPCLKLVDFGVAKQVDGAQDLTQTGAALGSPLYMSPEQMRGSRDVDGRADIWALGVTLYQLLAGMPPFYADTLTMVHLDPPTPLAQYRPDVPPSLAAVILQCLEKDRERRWPNISAFAAALAPHATAASAGYAARVARAQRVEVAQSQPTIEFRASSDAVLSDAASAIPVAAPRPRSSLGPALVVTAALLGAGLVLALAIFFGLHARGTGSEGTALPTSQPEGSGAPTAFVAASTVEGAPLPSVATTAAPTAAPPTTAALPSVATTAAPTATPPATAALSSVATTAAPTAAPPATAALPSVATTAAPTATPHAKPSAGARAPAPSAPEKAPWDHPRR